MGVHCFVRLEDKGTSVGYEGELWLWWHEVNS